MKRIAAIIACPFPEDHPKHLKSVDEDITNYSNFFLSAVGGAYHPKEVIIFRNFRLKNLDALIAFCRDAEYVTVVYTGHSHMVDGHTIFDLNPDEEMCISHIKMLAQRQIIIVDGCRVGTSSFLCDTGGIYGPGLMFDQTKLDLARHIFDTSLRSSGLGLAVLYSSSQGQFSYGSENGGLFSTALLTIAEEWGQQHDKPLLTTDEAFTRAKSLLTKRKARQTPDRKYSASEAAHFPFAISIRHYLRNESQKREVARAQAKKEAYGWLTVLGIGALVLGAIYSD